jgi:hypothetical protein
VRWTGSSGELDRKFRWAAPEIPVTGARACPRASILFRSSSGSSGTHRKFQLVQFARVPTFEKIVLGSVRKFRYGPKVLVMAPEVLVNPS